MPSPGWDAARASGLSVRPVMVLQYVLAALIGLFAGVVMEGIMYAAIH